eukprot:1139618-Pelagomonas_calceolata.AAC.3
MNKCEEQHHDDVLIITSSEHLLLSTDAGHTAATSILYSCLNAIITLRGTVFTASVITVTVGAGSTVRHDHIVAMSTPGGLSVTISRKENGLGRSRASFITGRPSLAQSLSL